MTYQDLSEIWESYKNGNISHSVRLYKEGGFTLDDFENIDYFQNGISGSEWEEIARFLDKVIN